MHSYFLHSAIECERDNTSDKQNRIVYRVLPSDPQKQDQDGISAKHDKRDPRYADGDASNR